MKGMDLGLACHKKTSQPNASFMGSNENESRDKMGHGSGHLKHQRSELAEDNINNNNIWRLSKMPRPGDVDFSSKKDGESLISTPFERSILWSPVDDGDGQKMLSFSSVDPHSGGGSSKSIGFSIYPDEHHSKAGGFGLNQGSKGPLTPSQWMELEHQALIYKHIEANLPIPSNLLVPLDRSLCSYGSPLLGWDPLHLGFSGSNDPEPGRCRRTDGKKWRCSRDAVPDQKYCERHINRGRHRSRKPVEGRTGHTLSGPTTASKAVLLPPAVPSSSAAVNASSGLRAMQPPISASASTDYLVTRSQEFQGLSLIPPTAPRKPKEVRFPVQQNCFTFQEPLNLEFGVVSSNSIPNPSGRISYLKTTATDASVRHFMDWPKDQSHHTTSGPWDEPLKPDWTQLSMSIPDITCSPTRAKPGPFLGPPQELDPIVHMGLGLGGKLSGPVQKVHQPAWQPIAWRNPLGEVLSSQVCGKSPTGVLQKQTFISGSNSSSGSGSSLRSGGEEKKGSTNNGSLGDDAFGSALLTSETVLSQ